VDYKIWGEMQQRVYQTKVHEADELKQHLTMYGMASDKTSSMTQLLMSGANVCVRVFVPKDDILSICQGIQGHTTDTTDTRP